MLHKIHNYINTDISLNHKFFKNKGAVRVARALLGKAIIIHRLEGVSPIGKTEYDLAELARQVKRVAEPRAIINKVAIITETEAYTQKDEASHSFRGKTERNKSMFLRAGYSYVYLIYGVHHCLNIVAEKEGVGSAVLIRGVILKEGEKERKIAGPGRVCKELKISRKHDGIDLLDIQSPIFIADVGISAKNIKRSERIGISKGKEKKWRFIA
ncbi:MAG: DNA-3-methyladenine glycosylase [Candidatus Campbellbacteria bacterium]|nr:DNA-3-methyladenine glycosylase [Candidatus Campbellbacteria bacterium]